MRPDEQTDRPVVIHVDDDISWNDFQIPGGSVPVAISNLRYEPGSRAVTLLVRFPAGWTRVVQGSYASPEDFLVIDGSLTMTGETYAKGAWVHVPAGMVRGETSSEAGALSLARFGGPARWTESSLPPFSPPLHRDLATTAALAPLVSPFGQQDGWLLRDEGGVSSWLLEPPPSGATVGSACEFFDLDRRLWFWVPQGTEIPHLEGLCFCRIFEATGGTQ